MSDKKGLEKQILEHLQLYRSLGVRYLKSPPFARQMQGRSKGSASAPNVVHPGGRKHDSGSEKAKSKAFVHNPSMFDEMPEVGESLEAVRADLGDCQRCGLAASRTHIVFGSGNPHAELMFVGEAPGADEDEQGLPFVGRAGKLLTKIIEAMEMRREDVYICNILKCRPPGNRNPESAEIAACQPFLFRQIDSVRPKVICTLGTFGSQTLLKTSEPISRLRGQFIDYRGTKLMATFHPAYLLRNPGEKRKVWEDVQKIRDYLRSQRPSNKR